LYVTGSNYSSPNYGATITKFSGADGSVLWDKLVLTNGTISGIPNSFYGVAVNGTNVYVAGVGANGVSPTPNMSIFSFDTSGNYLNSRGVSGVPNGASTPTLSADSSGVYLTASGTGGGFIIKFNTLLTALWANKIVQTAGGYTNNNINVAKTVPMPNGGLAISGSYYSTSTFRQVGMVGVIPTDGSHNGGTSLTLGTATLTYSSLAGVTTNSISSGYTLSAGSCTRSSTTTALSDVTPASGTIVGTATGPVTV
jgi:hypothetical protein